MRRAILALALFTAAFPVDAADAPILTRREGFLLLWRSIARPAKAVQEEPFADVPEGSLGFSEITFAKSRGILDPSMHSEQDSVFHPDNPLLLPDALLWLFRTRNVAEPQDMEPEDLHTLLERYPILPVVPRRLEPGFQSTVEGVSTDELLTLMRSLDALLRTEVHEISLYAEDFHGQGTAFGETFDMHALTAAHRTLPSNTLVRVTEIESGRSVVVRINDRGPFVPGRDMDLSLAAFTALAPRSRGTLRARFERLGDASLVAGCDPALRRYQERITREVRLQHGVPHNLPLGDTLTLKANRAFVVRAVAYPDGVISRMQDWVHPGESFALRPAITGEYRLTLGTISGRRRDLRMRVVECGK